MANYFVRSADGNDADNGTTWALAKQTLAGALAIAGLAAGDTIFVAGAHDENPSANISLDCSDGTPANPIRIICVDDTGDPSNPTTLATTGLLRTNGNFQIAIDGDAHVYGLTFKPGAAGANSACDINILVGGARGMITFEQCGLWIDSTHASATITIGPGSNSGDDLGVRFTNCTFRFSNVSQGIVNRAARVEVLGGSLDGAGTIPTVLCSASAGFPAQTSLIGVDLSAHTGALAQMGGAGASRYEFRRCRIHASTTLGAGTNPGPGGSMAIMDNCDSGDTFARMQMASYQGDVYSETTIVRTNGASDGATPFSQKMVSSAGANFIQPLYSREFFKYNSVEGSSKTLTVEIVHDSVTDLTDGEVWLEIEYLGTNGVPLGAFASDRKLTILSSAVAQDTSTVAWTTTGITNVRKQKLVKAITPQGKGLFRCRVALAKPSYTIYVDPVITVS